MVARNWQRAAANTTASFALMMNSSERHQVARSKLSMRFGVSANCSAWTWLVRDDSDRCCWSSSSPVRPSTSLENVSATKPLGACNSFKPFRTTQNQPASRLHETQVQFKGNAPRASRVADLCERSHTNRAHNVPATEAREPSSRQT